MLADRGLESVQIHPVSRMRWNFDRFHSDRIDNLEDSEICWALDRNDVTWASNGAEAKIQRFHPTARDDEFIRRKIAAISYRPPRDLPAKSRQTHSEIISAAVSWILAHHLVNDPIQFPVWIKRRAGRSGSQRRFGRISDGMHDLV